MEYMLLIGFVCLCVYFIYESVFVSLNSFLCVEELL